RSLAADLPGIEVRGIDVHIGSQIVEPEPYRQALLHVLEHVDALRADGIALEYLDIGGGFGVAYDARDTGMDARQLAALLAPLVAPSGLKLVLAPGRFIVGPAGVLRTRVLCIKGVGEGTFGVTDAGVNGRLR